MSRREYFNIFPQNLKEERLLAFPQIHAPHRPGLLANPFPSLPGGSVQPCTHVHSERMRAEMISATSRPRSQPGVCPLYFVSCICQQPSFDHSRGRSWVGETKQKECTGQQGGEPLTDLECSSYTVP